MAASGVRVADMRGRANVFIPAKAREYPAGTGLSFSFHFRTWEVKPPAAGGLHDGACQILKVLLPHPPAGLAFHMLADMVFVNPYGKAVFEAVNNREIGK